MYAYIWFNNGWVWDMKIIEDGLSVENFDYNAGKEDNRR